MASLTIPAPARPAPSRPAPRPAARGGLRLTRRGRRLLRTVVVLVVLVLALVGFAAGQGAVGNAGDSPARPATTRVVVQPGQTLWGIAAKALPDLDASAAVQRVADLNGLPSGAHLVPGQPLVLPLTGD